MPTYISKRTESQTQSVFFKLSAELRNEVYYHAFSMQDPDATEIHLCPKEARVATKDSFATKHEGIILALLRTCRRIYHEAAGVCYGINPIGIDRNMIYQLGAQFSSARLQNIRPLRVRVATPFSLNFVSHMTVARMPGVDKLDLVFDNSIDAESNLDTLRPYVVHKSFLLAAGLVPMAVSKLKTVSRITLTVGHVPDLLYGPQQGHRTRYERLIAMIQLQEDQMAMPAILKLEQDLNALLPMNKAKADAVKPEGSEDIEYDNKD